MGLGLLFLFFSTTAGFLLLEGFLLEVVFEEEGVAAVTAVVLLGCFVEDLGLAGAGFGEEALGDVARGDEAGGGDERA